MYNFLYVYNQNIDTGGLVFPRAIWQSFTGIYILEVCMTGLLGVRVATPQLILFAITIPITAIYQILLQWKTAGKLEYLDVTEGEDLEAGEDLNTIKVSPSQEKSSKTPVTQASINGGKTEGSQRIGAQVTGVGVDGSTGNQAVDAVAVQLTSEPQRGQRGIDNYYHPSVTAPVPVIWIPQDPLGISKEEIRDTEAAGDIKITDGGATLDEKNKLGWTEDPPDYEP
jgi:hypothetical protein